MNLTPAERICEMTFEEIFERIYGRDHLGTDVAPRELMLAQRQVSRLSNAEWHDWVEYKTARLDALRAIGRRIEINRGA